MICPDTDFDCDNPGCRHGGCQGRRPELPLLRLQNSPRLAEQASQAPLPRARGFSARRSSAEQTPAARSPIA